MLYRIKCSICEDRETDVAYIGETKRSVRLRFNEHVHNVKNGTVDTPIGDHFTESHQELQFVRGEIPLSVEILQKLMIIHIKKFASLFIFENIDLY